MIGRMPPVGSGLLELGEDAAYTLALQASGVE